MEITKEQILKLAKISCQAETFLKEEFPQAFDRGFDLLKLKGTYDLFSYKEAERAGFGFEFMQVRGGKEFKNKAFYLSDDYDWELKRDSENILCLIPSRK